MTTWTQDYPARPGSADAAALMVGTMLAKHLPHRGEEAGPLVRKLFTCALTRTSTSLNLVTIVAAQPFRARFELYFRNDLDAPHVPGALHLLSRLADAYGEQATRTGRMIYVELWDRL